MSKINVSNSVSITLYNCKLIKNCFSEEELSFSAFNTVWQVMDVHTLFCSCIDRLRSKAERDIVKDKHFCFQGSVSELSSAGSSEMCSREFYILLFGRKRKHETKHRATY